MEQVRIACKMSPNALVALANRCAAMGLMDTNEDKKRVRLFDLGDFGPRQRERREKRGEQIVSDRQKKKDSIEVTSDRKPRISVAIKDRAERRLYDPAHLKCARCKEYVEEES